MNTYKIKDYCVEHNKIEPEHSQPYTKASKKVIIM